MSHHVPEISVAVVVVVVGIYLNVCFQKCPQRAVLVDSSNL